MVNKSINKTINIWRFCLKVCLVDFIRLVRPPPGNQLWFRFRFVRAWWGEAVRVRVRALNVGAVGGELSCLPGSVMECPVEIVAGMHVGFNPPSSSKLERVRRPSIQPSIHHSSFIIHHSSFIIHHSTIHHPRSNEQENQRKSMKIDKSMKIYENRPECQLPSNHRVLKASSQLKSSKGC